jgi:hypothetical protein
MNAQKRDKQIIKGFEYSLIDYKNNSIGATGTPGINFTKFNSNPKYLVLHSTDGPNFDVNLNLLSSKIKTPKNIYVCAHYMIANDKEKNGLIYQMVDERLRAIHANNLNDQSIGIELIDDGKKNEEYKPFTTLTPKWLTPEQYLSLLILCLDICENNGIQTKYISCYENISNPNIINLGLPIESRNNKDSSSDAIVQIKNRVSSGIVFHKDFRNDKLDPIDFNGLKFINDLNKEIEIINLPDKYTIKETFIALVNNTIKIDDIKGSVNFELLPNSEIKQTFQNLLNGEIKNSKIKRKNFEKKYNQTTQGNLPIKQRNFNFGVSTNDPNGN